jgi:hypothetical protein
LEEEVLGESGNEGIPNLVIHGISARVELKKSDVVPFCQLAGFSHGFVGTRVRVLGGYIWNIDRSECILSIKTQCTYKKHRLLNKRFDGVYVFCVASDHSQVGGTQNNNTAYNPHLSVSSKRV